jgi:hypothetical protein
VVRSADVGSGVRVAGSKLGAVPIVLAQGMRSRLP